MNDKICSCPKCQAQRARMQQQACDMAPRVPVTIEDLPFAVAYVRPQAFGEVFSLEEALCRGTLFPCLYKPYVQEVRTC